MDGLQFITSNPVRDGRRQAFGEAVARQKFEDSQADREIAADERARLATERQNKAALDEAYRQIAAGQATGDTMQDELARSVAAIPGGGEVGLEAIQARNEAAAAQAAAQQERVDLERKRSDQQAELASNRGFQLLKLGAVAEAKAEFERAGMNFPPQFYTDRAMQARTEQALKTAKQFYEHDPQNAAKFTAAVMQGMSVDEAVQKFPPMQKSLGGATTYRDVVMPDGTIQTIAIAPGSTEGVPVTAGGQNVTPVPRTTPARARTQDFTVTLSDGSQATVPGQVIDGRFQPTLSNGYLGVSFNAGGDPSKIAEVYQRLGVPMPAGMAPPPVEQPEKPGFVSQLWDQITGAGSEPQTATAATPQPTWSDAFASGGNVPATTGLAGVNAGQPAPAPAAAPVAAPAAPVTSPSNTAPGEPVVTTEGLRFPDGEVVPIGGMVYQGGQPFIVQSITPDPATGELIVNVTPTGQ